MVDYYFDLETYSPGDEPNPAQDKIITIQYQELWPIDGNPRGKLQILTEWDFGSEKAMLEEFAKVFFGQKVWDFIPVGFNLYGFDLISLLSRYDYHFGTSHGIAWLHDKPVLDIKSTLVLLEKGNFKGSGDIFGKRDKNPVKEWYELGVPGRAQIIAYVEHEANRFHLLHKNLRYEIPRLRDGLQRIMA
jgi:hypothetical protein